MHVGVIGIGFGQAAHAPAVRSVEGLELTAIVATEEERALRVAQRLGVPNWYGSWETALDSGQLELVTIAVPPDLQPAIVEAAATRGIHVLCEKPLASDVQGAQRALAAVRGAGVRHAIDFEIPESPAWQELRRLQRSGCLGDVRALSIRWCFERRPHPSPRSRWKDSVERGGGVFGGFLSHALYHVELFGGPVATLAARVPHGRPEAPAILSVHGSLTNGARFEVTLDATGTSLHEHVVELAGSDASAVLRNVGTGHGGPFELEVEGEPHVSIRDPDAPQDGDARIQAVTSLIGRFARAIRSGAPMSPDLTDGARVQSLLAGVHLSIRSEAAVTL